MFFIFVLTEGELYGHPEFFVSLAKSANAIPCFMSMELKGNEYVTKDPGWGLIYAETYEQVDPAALVSDELIEISDRELQDFAVRFVCNELEQQGKEVVSYHSVPGLNPSIRFEEDGNQYWVLLRAGRYPESTVEKPDDLESIIESFSDQAVSGFFAAVIVANSDDPFDPAGDGYLRLYRGYSMFVKYEGLEKIY